MTISKPFKGIATGKKSHENANQYSRIFYGDQNVCEQWITYAQTILSQVLLRPGTHSRRVKATPDVEVYVTCRPNRIEINAGGEIDVLVTVGDKYSATGVYPTRTSPPFQSESDRILYKTSTQEIIKNNFYAGGKSNYYDYVLYYTNDHHAVDINWGDFIHFTYKIYNGGYWYGYGNKYISNPASLNKKMSLSLSWTIKTNNVTTFYINGKFGTLTTTSPIKIITATCIPVNSDLLARFSGLSLYTSVLIVLYRSTDGSGNTYFLNIYGVDTPIIDQFNIVYMGQTEISFLGLIISENLISDFSKDAQRIAFATDVYYPQDAYITTFSSDYSTYSHSLILSSPSEFSIVSIRPDGDDFCALRSTIGEVSPSGIIEVINFSESSTSSVVSVNGLAGADYTLSSDNLTYNDISGTDGNVIVNYYSAKEGIIIYVEIGVTISYHEGVVHVPDVVGTAYYTSTQSYNYATTTGITNIATALRPTITCDLYGFEIVGSGGGTSAHIYSFEQAQINTCSSSSNGKTLISCFVMGDDIYSTHQYTLKFDIPTIGTIANGSAIITNDAVNNLYGTPHNPYGIIAWWYACSPLSITNNTK